jgi:hypothetical protein
MRCVGADIALNPRQRVKKSSPLSRNRLGIVKIEVVEILYIGGVAT